MTGCLCVASALDTLNRPRQALSLPRRLWMSALVDAVDMALIAF
ncbi:hypothetical protein SynBIOSE41_00158 [Synechococcus sp. BIOS-E4-1]|nr:hypothetical protein SynBIOSE41_00158 [Synechococcus sp. BIOS-E4-1]